MQVPYEIRDATFGKGLFARERIPAGTLIWDRSAANLTEVPASEAEEHVAKLDRCALRTLLEYAYFGADAELVDLSPRLRELVEFKNDNSARRRV